MRSLRRIVRSCLPALSACGSPGSALPGGAGSVIDPAGEDARQIAEIFWWMLGGGTLVWLGVMLSAVYAATSSAQHAEKTVRRFVLFGGVVIPSIVLVALLIFGLRTLPALLSLGPEETPAIRVSAEQWWWRASYVSDDGRSFEVAGELHIPVGERTTFELQSPDVIHSFWVPALGGKVDTIPGRTTFIALEPTREGRFAGICAEYCGVSHAQMRFEVVAEDPESYARWWRHQASDALAPETDAAREGARVFLAAGCGSCHTVRGTDARGTLGPDLTHIAGRRLLAGMARRQPQTLREFVREPSGLKPGAHMPGFSTLEDDELDAIVAYLEALP